MEQEQTSDEQLREIAAHLKSIRGMLQFFTLILVLAIVVQVLDFLLSF